MDSKYSQAPGTSGTLGEHNAQTPAGAQLTSRQRNTVVINRGIANDMDRGGTTAEHHTAALLRLVVDAIERGYEAELVRVAREWRAEVEAEG